MPKSILEIVRDCDNFPYNQPGDTAAYEQQLSTLWKFYLPNDPRPHGYLVDWVVQRMPWTEDFHVLPSPHKEIHLLPPASASDTDDPASSSGPCDSWTERCERSIDALLDAARATAVFPKLGRKRADSERFPIVGARVPVSMDRAAISLFGIIGRGVHLTVYVRTSAGLKFWVPRRNERKATYPGLLDNTVAGGVAAGEAPLECLVREAEEEAGMDAGLVRQARAAGTVTWLNVSDERAGGEPGLMNPGLLYVYDLEVGPEVVLRPVDEEDVAEFCLMDVQEVLEAMAEGRFKPASASVMVDFFVRHGLITAEDEEDYADIVSRLHRILPFATSPGSPGPKRS
ncbi:putative thiamine pyrophosphokinase [Aspergillus clavatus NRRL 1]|uniref:Thiamin pyrophosphokinase, putative n=1 Tax=Aspergillus clavatus (strain ATCC 1007 / CBS 513.65 / DSM 816 / NCTC 3887 / NRRL 1 / QM 1276 / 107) TaxID=344612 RepID=A1CSB1_ASPCL|nr:thiamine pyrophosphokinase, putative [Aspergillus clavatus NRRL 1]EAW08532.1 thiamin pyrophosphokinase, putative [Aspergillus clavatus NRRL 1]